MGRTITITEQGGEWWVLDTGTASLTIGLCADEAMATAVRMMADGRMPNFSSIPTQHTAYWEHMKRIKEAAKKEGAAEAVEEMKKQFMLLPHLLQEGTQE